MSQHSTSDMPIKFRGIRERNLIDQIKATESGYANVEQMAIDELAARIITLETRVGVLEGGELEPIEGQG